MHKFLYVYAKVSGKIEEGFIILDGSGQKIMIKGDNLENRMHVKAFGAITCNKEGLPCLNAEKIEKIND